MEDELIDDPEEKRSTFVSAITIESRTTDKLLEHYSDWYRLKRAVAIYIRHQQFLRHSFNVRRKQKEEYSTSEPSKTVDEIQRAETRILRYVQKMSYPEEVAILCSNKTNELAKRVQSID